MLLFRPVKLTHICLVAVLQDRRPLVVVFRQRASSIGRG